MTLLRSLVVVGVSSLVLVGCGKKSQETTDEVASPEVVSEKSSDDLFDEFYEETEKSTDEATSTSEDKNETIKDEYSSTGSSSSSNNSSTSSSSSSSIGSTPRFSLDGRYVVQVSCLASEEIAEDVAKKFENYGYPVYVAEVLNPTPRLLGKYFRIRIGGFDNLTDANGFGDGHLMPAGFEYWVDNRSNDNVGIGDFGLGDDDFSFSEEPAVAETSTPDPVQETVTEPVVEAVVETVTETVVEEVVETVTEPVVEAVAESVPTTTGDDDWGTSEW